MKRFCQLGVVAYLANISHSKTLFLMPNFKQFKKFHCHNSVEVKPDPRHMAQRAVPISVSVALGNTAALSSESYGRRLAHRQLRA